MALSADGSPLDDATLAAHLDFVRRLARALVRDESAADDLAQETWITALRSPPREGFAWKAWLSGVARRLAWRSHRSEQRRTRHERSGAEASSGGHAPPAAETAALLELSQRVIAELHALGEPHATTVRRRFLDGLAADEIARLEGVPVETVRTRVKRALAQLRQRLDERHGGRRDAWAGVLVPWAGSVVMGVKAKLAVTALVIAAVGGVGWWAAAGGGGKALLPMTGDEGAAGVATAANATEEGGGMDGLRAEGGAPVATRSAVPTIDSAQDAIGIVLQGRVVHPDGHPFERLSIRLDGESSRIASMGFDADASGAFAFANLSAGRWRVRVTNVEGCEPLDQWVAVAPAPTVQCVELRLERSLLLPIRIVTPDGRRLFEVLEPNDRGRVSRALAIRSSREPPRRELPPNPWSSSRPRDGRGFWIAEGQLDLGRSPRHLVVPPGCDGVLPVASVPCHVGVSFKHLLLHAVRAESVDAPLSLIVDPDEIEELHATVELRAVDADTGAPLPGGHYDLSDRQSGTGGKTADRDGVVRFEHVQPGLLHLQRMPDRNAELSRFVRVDPGEPIDLGDIRIAKTAELSGSVVDEAGRPQQGVSLEWYELAALTPDQPIDTMHSIVSGTDGRFSIFGAPKTRVLLVGQSRSGSRWQVVEPVVVDATNRPPEDLTLVARATTPLRFELGDTLGEPVTVRVERGDGLPFDWSLVEGPVDWPRPLSPGTWRFVVESERRGRIVRDVAVGSEPLLVQANFDDAAGVAAREVVDAQPCAEHAGAKPETARLEGALLYGALVDRDGKPIQLKRAQAVDGDGKRHSGGGAATGGFTLPGLPPGDCDVEIEADGFVPWRASLQIAADARLMRKDLVLERKLRIPVRFVTPDGTPLGASVRHIPRGPTALPPLTLLVTRRPLAEPPPPGRGTSRASEVGRFVRGQGNQPSEFDGTLEVEGALPVVLTVVLDRKIVQSLELAEPRDEMVVTINPALLDAARATVLLRAVDAITDQPVALTYVMCGDENGEMGFTPESSPPPDGSYRIDQRNPGYFSLGLQADGYPAMRLRMTLEPGETRDLGTVRLLPEAKVSGRFVDEEAKPVPVAYSLQTAEIVPGLGSRGRFMRNDVMRDGAFAVSTGRGRLWLSVREDAWAWQTTVVDASSGRVDGLEIALAKGVRVRFVVDAPRWRQFTVAVRDEAGGPVGETVVEGGSPLRFSLRPGRYRVALAEDGVDRGEHELVVGAEPVAVTLPMK